MLLELDVFGDVQVRRKLLRFGDRARDASPAFERIADELFRIERQQFNTEGGYGQFGVSSGWDELAPATIASKAASSDATVRANAENILRATDATFRSLVDEGDPGNLKDVGSQELVFGTKTEQARFHQPDPQGRRLVEVPPRDRRYLVEILQRHLVGEVRT